MGDRLRAAGRWIVSVWGCLRDWVGENPRSLHVYPGMVLVGWAAWRLQSSAVSAAVVGGLLIYFGAFWRPPGARETTKGE